MLLELVRARASAYQPRLQSMTRAKVVSPRERDDLPASEDVVIAKRRRLGPFAAVEARLLVYRVSPRNRAAILPARQSDETTRSHAFLSRPPRGESFDFDGIPSIVGARRRSDARARVLARIEITRAN